MKGNAFLGASGMCFFDILSRRMHQKWDYRFHRPWLGTQVTRQTLQTVVNGKWHRTGKGSCFGMELEEKYGKKNSARLSTYQLPRSFLFDN